MADLPKEILRFKARIINGPGCQAGGRFMTRIGKSNYDDRRQSKMRMLEKWPKASKEVRD